VYSYKIKKGRGNDLVHQWRSQNIWQYIRLE
jgi:hypothetical protein